MNRKIVRATGAILVAASLALPALGVSAQRWDNEPTAYLYRTTCAEAENSRNATEISELEDDRITLRRVWSEIGTGGDRPNGMWGEIDDIDHLGNVQSLVNDDYAVVIHQDDSRRSPIIACVDVEGTVTPEGTLLLDIAQVDNSGMEGRVLIRQVEREPDELEFAIGIWNAGAVPPVSEATPAS